MFLSLFTLCISSLGCALLVPLVQGTCSIQGPKSRWAFSRVCQSPCRPLPLQPLHLFLPQIIQKTPFFTLNCLQQAQTRLPRWAHRASNPPHWGILHPPGNSVLMKMLSLAGHCRSLPRCPRSLPSPMSLSHRSGAAQGSSGGSGIPGTAIPGGCGKGRRLRRSPRASGHVFYSVVGGIFQLWLLGPVPLQLQLYSPFQRQRRQTVSTPLPFRACQKPGGPATSPGPRGALAKGGGGRAHGTPGHHLRALRCHTRQRVRGIKQQLVYF